MIILHSKWYDCFNSSKYNLDIIFPLSNSIAKFNNLQFESDGVEKVNTYTFSKGVQTHIHSPKGYKSKHF
jgi:hypothetical protein